MGHECSHVRKLGWASIQNGALIAKAEKAGYEVLITLDQGIPREQVSTTRSLAIFVIVPVQQGKNAVKVFAAEILESLTTVEPGAVKVFTHRPA